MTPSERGCPAPPARLRPDAAAVAIRTAGAGDARAVALLAALDEAEPPAAPILLAEVDGEAWAAIGVDDGRVVADPFRPAAPVVALLVARAAHVRGELPRRRIPRLRLRAA